MRCGRLTLEVNVTANYLLADEAAKIFAEQGIDASVVLTSSANAVVAKRGSEAYDVSKAALSHLVRELRFAVAEGAGKWDFSGDRGEGIYDVSRDRVIASLKKYKLPFEETMTDDELRNVLAKFYAKRTLTHQPIDPRTAREAIMFLAGPRRGARRDI